MIIGIDPGLAGTLAFLEAESGRLLDVVDMPILMLTRGGKRKKDLDVHAFARLIGDRRPDHAYVEQVGAMPGQGVSSVFAFGKSFGAVIGILATLDVPMSFVPPAVWKRTLAVPKAKDGARARASQLLPKSAHLWPLVGHDGRAEAALIALYGRRSELRGFGHGQEEARQHGRGQTRA
jgi:crossover junction endodeoxyribonuclease RuvC